MIIQVYFYTLYVQEKITGKQQHKIYKSDNLFRNKTPPWKQRLEKQRPTEGGNGTSRTTQEEKQKSKAHEKN